jgi:hypothetical protein
VREHEVPQDDSFYHGHRRACYAVDGSDRYVLARSRGWEVERIATEQALLDLEQQVEHARRRVLAGELAPLAYHLATRQMTPRLCAQHLGIGAWRVKRHLRPAVFAKLSPRMLERYAACLDRTSEELSRVPEEAGHVFLDGDA